MFRFFSIFIYFLFFLCMSTVCFADLATLTVRGEAELKVPADRAVFNLAVVTEAATSEQALQANSERMEKVIDALQRIGLVEQELSSGQFTISPRWSPRPRQAPEGWRSEIIGFSVTNRLQVQTLKLDLVGKVIAVAVKAGINELRGLQFDLADPRQYRQEAIRIATARAHEDARVLADAADAVLGQIVELNLDDARALPIAMPRGRFAEVATAGMTPPVLPGDVTVRASVTAVYELQ